MSEQSIETPAADGARQRATIVAAALLAVSFWGGTPIATKLAVAGLDPLAVGLLRTLLAGLLVVPLLALSRLAPPRTLTGRALLAVSALGGFVLFPLLFSLGLGLTSAAHGALILALLPIFTGLLAAALERRWPGARWWLGAGVAAAGTVWLVGGRFDLSDSGADLTGDLLVTASALAASGGYVAGAKVAREAGTWSVTFWGLAFGGLVLLPVLPFVVGPVELVRAEAGVWFSLLYLACGSSILAYAAWYWALGKGDIGRTGLIQFAQPVISLILAAAVLGEAVTWPLVLAAAVIIGGVALARSGARPAKA